eukprot:418041-Rhodomonas_salina.1
MSENPVNADRSRHIDTRHFHLRGPACQRAHSHRTAPRLASPPAQSTPQRPRLPAASTGPQAGGSESGCHARDPHSVTRTGTHPSHSHHWHQLLHRKLRHSHSSSLTTREKPS